MLERLTAKVAPAKLNAEILEIETKLAALDAEREELRLLAGRLVIAQGSGFDSVREREIVRHRQRIAEMDIQRTDLRDRRRLLTQLLQPAPAAEKALVDVPMSAELVAACDALERAREARQKLIAERYADSSEAGERKRVKKLAEAEDEIARLRVARGVLLQPYNEALAEAMSPLIREAAKRLDAASAAFLEAMQDLREVNSRLPPTAPGMGNGMGAIMGITTKGALDARAMCAELLHRNPESAE